MGERERENHLLQTKGYTKMIEELAQIVLTLTRLSACKKTFKSKTTKDVKDYSMHKISTILVQLQPPDNNCRILSLAYRESLGWQECELAMILVRILFCPPKKTIHTIAHPRCIRGCQWLAVAAVAAGPERQCQWSQSWSHALHVHGYTVRLCTYRIPNHSILRRAYGGKDGGGENLTPSVRGIGRKLCSGNICRRKYVVFLFSRIVSCQNHSIH